MIFFFSGSGNSYAIAKQLADKLPGEQVIPLSGFDAFNTCCEQERIGIVFPCYIGKAPKTVVDFKKRLIASIDKQKTYVFCVINYANSPAISYLDFEDIANAWFEVKMPENDIVNSKAPAKEKIEQLLTNAEVAVDSFLADIATKKNTIMYRARPVQKVILKLVSGYMMSNLVGHPERFYADEHCTKCKQCTKYCPLKNIGFESVPVWGNNCVGCLGCVNRCPSKAIQSGKKTIGKQRYVHPSYDILY